MPIRVFQYFKRHILSTSLQTIGDNWKIR